MLHQADPACIGEPAQRPALVPRVLVTGVDRVVGGNIALWLGRRAEVSGVYEDHQVALPGCETGRWDPRRPATIRELCRGAGPDWIIHCGPLACGSWDLFQEFRSLKDFGSLRAQETAVCGELLAAADYLGASLTVVLTDAVFAGPRMFHDEQSPAAGQEPLAMAAREVERLLEGRRALVVRTHAYGWGSRAGEPTFAERVWMALAEGLPCPLDPRRHATPILASDLADILWLAYRRGIEGLYHIAGAERASAFRFAHELAGSAGLPMPDQAADPRASVSPTDRRWETSLDTRRARQELGRPMPMLREGLARFVAQVRDGTRTQLQNSSAVLAQREAA
jgi:dTDP-4-dehydrorhamnose reductase